MEPGARRKQNLESWNQPRDSGSAKEEGVSQRENSACLLGFDPLCHQAGMPCSAPYLHGEAQRACVDDRVGRETETLQSPGRDTRWSLSLQNKKSFLNHKACHSESCFYISGDFVSMLNFIKGKCMQNLKLLVCMDAWELAGKGDGHTLWVRISSKPNTGEDASASAGTIRR